MNPEIQPTIQKSFGEWRTFYPAKSEELDDMYWDAVELMENNPPKAERLFKKVIFKCGNGHLDAILHLGLLFNKNNKAIEGNALVIKAYLLAKGAFPKEFDFNHDELHWSDQPNRPILRSLQAYGLELMKEHQFEDAIVEFNRILKLNSGDNQGIRYLILDCLINLEKYREAIELTNKYDDYSVDFLYGKMISYYLLQEFDKASEQLVHAREAFPHVAKELIKSRHSFPYDEFDFPTDGFSYPVGSRQEAFQYWNRNKDVYEKAEGVRNFIKNGIT